MKTKIHLNLVKSHFQSLSPIDSHVYNTLRGPAHNLYSENISYFTVCSSLINLLTEKSIFSYFLPFSITFTDFVVLSSVCSTAFIRATYYARIQFNLKTHIRIKNALPANISNIRYFEYSNVSEIFFHVSVNTIHLLL